MTVHTGWKRNKPGLFDKQIQEARKVRCEAFLKVPEHKKSLMVALYGGRKNLTEAVAEHVEWERSDWPAQAQHNYGFSSEHGDFTNCYRGGFY